MEDEKKVVITQKKPYLIDLEKGKTYKWCTCGKSEDQPFCDGSHKVEGVFRSQHFVVENTGKHKLCGCRHSKNKPFCDSAHRNL